MTEFAPLKTYTSLNDPSPQALGYAGVPPLSSRASGLSGGISLGPGPVNVFAGGGDGSVFAPPARQVANPPPRGFG